MTPASDRPAENTDAVVEATARDWLVRLYSDEVSDADRQAFRAWLLASPDHAKTYKALELVWRDVSLAPGSKAELDAKSHDVDMATWPAARWVAVAACLLLAVGASLFGDRHAAVEGWHSSGIGEVKTVVLDDGSVVTLGARSSLETRFSGSRRDTRLVQGTAFFDVAENPSRPFTVTVAETTITVTGTEFDVRYGPANVRIAVAEGSVDVADASMEHGTKLQASLSAGEQVIATLDGSIASQGQFDAQVVGAWREGRLVYLDARLEDIVADVNRYRDTPIRLRDDALLDLRITTSFRVEDSDQMLSGLAASYPVEIKSSDFSVSVWPEK